MSLQPEDEDDYLSDKFLGAGQPSSSKELQTYSSIRKEAQKRAQAKNEQNRLKSRRQREIESRKEGLSKSLFERAQDEEAVGFKSGNKALSIMMKMGFKLGQSLGAADEEDQQTSNSAVADIGESDNYNLNMQMGTKIKSDNLVDPLPIHERAGKEGIGLGPRKRSRSPSAVERMAKMAKMAKMADESHQTNYRDRAKYEYLQKQAEIKLRPAQLTCSTLDKREGQKFNVLWLNPNYPETFPSGLADSLVHHGKDSAPIDFRNDTIQMRLQRQMRKDMLQSLEDLDGPFSLPPEPVAQFSNDILEETAHFLRLQPQERLFLVLAYLRDKYRYCFWCGVEYENDELLNAECPGSQEDDH